MYDTVQARVVGRTAAWPGTEPEVSVTAMDGAAEEPALRTGESLPAGAPSVPAGKPLLRGWLHLISFEASLVMGTLALANAHGAVRITVIAVFAASVSAMFGASALYHRGNWAAVAQAPAAAGPRHSSCSSPARRPPPFLIAAHRAARVGGLIAIRTLTLTAAAIHMAWMNAPELVVGGRRLGGRER